MNFPINKQHGNRSRAVTIYKLNEDATFSTNAPNPDKS